MQSSTKGRGRSAQIQVRKQVRKDIRQQIGPTFPHQPKAPPRKTRWPAHLCGAYVRACAMPAGWGEGAGKTASVAPHTAHPLCAFAPSCSRKREPGKAPALAAAVRCLCPASSFINLQSSTGRSCSAKATLAPIHGSQRAARLAVADQLGLSGALCLLCAPRRPLLRIGDALTRFFLLGCIH